MKKLFIALLALSLTTSAILFLLLKSKAPHVEDHGATASAPVHDEHAKVEGEAPHAGQAPAETPHAKEGSEHAASDVHEKPTTESHASSPPEASAHAEVKEPPVVKAPSEESGGDTPVEVKESSTPETVKQKVRLVTSPTSASVYVNGDFMGTSPLDIDLGETPQKVKIEALRYKSFEKELPAANTEEAKQIVASVWKVNLEKAGRKTARAKARPSTFIQLKAFPANQAEATALAQGVATKVYDELGLNTKVCRVDLGSKGQWIRVLAGPFENKNEASQLISAIAELKLDSEEPFIRSGEKQCLR